MCGTRQQVGGGGRIIDQVGALADGDVRHPRHVLEYSGLDWFAGQCFERGGPDESQRGFGGDDADRVAGLGELTNDGGGLVGGDTPGDADDDPLAVVRFSSERLIASPPRLRYSPSVCSSRSPWISRIAIDSGFSCNPGSTSGPTYSRMPSPSWL